jgi:hypothetical protein
VAAQCNAGLPYHRHSECGLQEASVTNYTGDPRRGIVISRSDPTGFPNRADRVTGINLNTQLKNLLGTGKQTTAIAFVPQRTQAPADDPNQQFFFRIKVLDDDTVKMGLKRFVLQ